MPLRAGEKLGPYEILAPVGAGGMGEVYRARDTRLDRLVAIKIASSHLSGRPEFRERFGREARAISSLKHPHICILHDLGSQDGVDYVVMEYLEGETLAHRLKKGPLPAHQVLEYAIQIADALATAHSHGVIHRDIKPGNIMLTKQGAKLLDFGLAKLPARQALAVAADHSARSTETPLTGPGIVLGTMQYMAPEQLEGREADARTDLFALGAVLYEMATGLKAFEGKSQVSLIAAILTAEPPSIAALEGMSPLALDHVVRTCLAKDPEMRWSTAHDIVIELKWIAASGSPEGAAAAAPARWKRRVTLLSAVVAFLMLLIVAFVHFREEPPQTPVVRSSIAPPEKTVFRFDAAPNGPPALSPDGRSLVFGTQFPDGATRLWVRSLDSIKAQPLAGTESAFYSFPFWSPDGRSIGFSADGKLKKMDLAGGPPVTLADVNLRGASWSPQGVIVFALNSVGPLQRIPADGGTPAPATAIDPSRKENAHRWPWFLPDGRHFLYASVVNGVNHGDATIYVGSLDSRQSRIVSQANSNAIYASGYLLFLRDNTLMAQPFDPKRLVTTGDPVPVAEQIAADPTRARGFFTASDNGTLVFQSGGLGVQTLAWLNRAGQRLETVGEAGRPFRVFLAPGAKRAVVSVFDRAAGNYDLWIYDLARDRRSRFTFDPANENEGIWSPDGSWIVFSSDRRGHFDLYRKLSSGAGAEDLLYADGLDKRPVSWSPDGKFVMYDALGDPNTKFDLWVLPLEGERKPFPFLHGRFNELQGQFSPDGRWVAYQSDESGRSEIYIAPFQGTGGKRQVSVAGGILARWRADGKELFYIGANSRLMAVEVDLKGAEVEIGAVRPLFGPLLTGHGYQYDVSPDGQRFLAIVYDEQSAPEPLTLVQNWTAGLRK